VWCKKGEAASPKWHFNEGK